MALYRNEHGDVVGGSGLIEIVSGAGSRATWWLLGSRAAIRASAPGKIRALGTLCSVLAIPENSTYDLSMTDDDILAILRKAAAKLDHDVDIFPERHYTVEIRDDRWCFVGWINYPRIEKTYDVWWHAERGEGRLWPWAYENLRWSCRPFPLQSD